MRKTPRSFSNRRQFWPQNSQFLTDNVNPTPLYEYNEIACVMIAFAAAPFALWTTGNRGNKNDMMFGDLSFIVYSMHWPAIQLMGSGGGSYTTRMAFMFCDVIGILLLSLIVWRYVDHPINKVRSIWVSRRMNTEGIRARPAVA